MTRSNARTPTAAGAQRPHAGPATPQQIAAVVFDLDGVITQTARLHALAWKALFDDYFAERHRRGDDPEPQPPFNLDHDYRRYVDGKPRLDGVRSLLAARGIRVPDGTADDPPEAETVHGLGTRKNETFRRLITERGVGVFEDALVLLDALRARGIPAAVVSSSRNCRLIVEQVGLTDRFAARVDGEDLQRLNLAGKPNPDMFVRAVEEIGVTPEQAVVLEDARSGVEAGRRGRFGLVVGVDRVGTGEHEQALYDSGADLVLRDLSQLVATLDQPARRHVFARLPDALRQADPPWQRTRPVLFVDYDGTLSPIVRNPAAAVMLPGMREALQAAAAVLPVFVVSGRDTAVVRDFVDLDSLVYAGSHGMHIVGPDGLAVTQPGAQAAVPALDAVERTLHDALRGIEGAKLERKRFALAVHYRNLAEAADAVRVERIVRDAVAEHLTLRVGLGKKVYEVRPAIEWDKGRAVLWLLDKFGLRDEHLPLYLGDDLTDEDAFVALANADAGPGILVGDHEALTAASYRLADVPAVREFLQRLTEDWRERPA